MSPSRSSRTRTCGIGVRHPEQKLGEAGELAGVGTRPGRHRAVVVRRPVLASTWTSAGQHALLPEQQQVAVDHAGGVDLSGGERASSVALAADVVAVQADADVEALDGNVVAGLQRPAGAAVAGESAWPAASRWRRSRSCARAGRRATRRPASPRVTITEVRSQSVSRIVTGCNVDAAGGGEPAGPHPRQRRVPGDVDDAPSTSSST